MSDLHDRVDVMARDLSYCSQQVDFQGSKLQVREDATSSVLLTLGSDAQGPYVSGSTGLDLRHGSDLVAKVQRQGQELSLSLPHGVLYLQTQRFAGSYNDLLDLPDLYTRPSLAISNVSPTL